MGIRRMLAIGFIFLVACAGWAALGTTTLLRSDQFSSRLGGEVEALWGAPIVQESPVFTVKIPGTEKTRRVMPVKNEVVVDLRVDYRQKGLVWYPTFVCDFSGAYAVVNPETVTQKVQVRFAFPSARATYDRFSARLDGKPLDIVVNTAEGIGEILELAPGETREFRVTYRTRGLGEWRYRPDPATGRVRNLDLAVTTDFRDVDFPDGTLSPMEKQEGPDGMRLRWKADDLITAQDVGVVIPERLNPGPVSSRITFFAPVSLFFFFVLVAAIAIVKGMGVHPMHYLFMAAGFFAFHLLFAYLVDHVNIHLSFALAAVASVLLVTGYLSAALGGGFPWRVAGAGQVLYLVVFSYTFFFRGLTGLMVSIFAVLTLAVLMRMTAKTRWEEVFA